METMQGGLLFFQIIIVGSVLIVSTSARSNTRLCQSQDLLAPEKKTGQCPSSSEKYRNCCKCSTCLPGNEKAQETNECCKPCRWEDPFFYFSNAEVGTENCLPCISCDIMKRETLVNCTPTQNAKCGNCKPGYITLDSTKETSPCTLNTSSELNPYKSFDAKQGPVAEDLVANPAENSLEQEDTTYKKATIVLAACMGLLVACVVIFIVFSRDRILHWYRKPAEAKHRRTEDDADHIELENMQNTRIDPTIHFEEEGQTELLAEVSSRPIDNSSELRTPLTIECSGPGPDQFCGSTSTSGDTSYGSSVEECEENKHLISCNFTSFKDNSCFTKTVNYQGSVSLPFREESPAELESLEISSESVLSTEGQLNKMNNEHLLDVAIRKAGQRVINNTPDDVLDILGHFLDSQVANRNPQVLKGRVGFAVTLGVNEELAYTFTNSSDLFSHLKGKRVLLYKMLETLSLIDRCDALCEVTKAMFKKPNW